MSQFIKKNMLYVIKDRINSYIKKKIDHKNDDKMFTVEDYLSCSVVCTFIRYTVGKFILNIPKIQEIKYISKQVT